MANCGQILHGKDNGIHVFKFVGVMRCVALAEDAACRTLDALLDQLFEKRDFEHMVFDLTEVESIDSLHVGLVAKAGAFMLEQMDHPMTVFSDQPYVNGVLHTMGLEKLFTIVDGPPEAKSPATETLAGGPPNEAIATLLSAHRALAALNEENRARFQDVIEALERESEGR